MNPRTLPLTFFLLFVFPLSLLAQETVHPITVVQRKNDFYVEQYKLWKAVTEKTPDLIEGWRNLYHAARYRDFPAIFNDSTYKKEVDQLIAEMGEAIPNTYDYHYIYAWHHGFGEDNFDHLMKAYAIDSTRPKICEDLFTHHYARGAWDQADYYIHKWYNHQTMAPQLLHFCYNLLASTGENGILLTSGDNDSYPIWMLQAVQEFRTDVTALNAYILMDPEFARKAAARHGLKIDESAYALLGRKKKDKWQKMGEFIRHLAEKNPDRDVYIPMTVPGEFREALGDDLYIVGTVFRYSPTRFDNIAHLKRNWSRHIKLDYLDFMVYNEKYLYTPEGLPYTVLVYMYPAMTLYHHYKAAGEAQEAEAMLEFARKLSTMVGDPDHYKRFLEDDDE